MGLQTLAWQRCVGFSGDEGWLLSPSVNPNGVPKGVIHFLGGAFVGGAPQLVYDGLLTTLAQAGYGIIATPYFTQPDHQQVAIASLATFSAIQRQQGWQSLPWFGLGHSLGCKLHLLNSLTTDSFLTNSPPVRPRQGNILMAYSNAGVQQALPGAAGLPPLPPELEFRPSPATTEQWLQSRYPIAANLLVKFVDDTIDDLSRLYPLLQARFGSQVTYRVLPGNHGTSTGGRYPFPPSESFSPWDALGQFVYQQLNQDNRILATTLEQWLGAQVTGAS